MEEDRRGRKRRRRSLITKRNSERESKGERKQNFAIKRVGCQAMAG